MHILFFCTHFPKTYNEPFVSGLVKNGFNQAKAVAATGADVTVITDGPHIGVWEIAGMRVFGVGNGILKGILRAAILDVQMTWRFVRLGRKSFDVVHIHSGNLVLFFILRTLGLVSATVVYTAHGTTTPELDAHHTERTTWYDRLVRANGWVQERIDAFMWRNADRIISVSDFQIREMQKIYTTPKERIVRVYNGVDADRYHRDTRAGAARRNVLEIGESAPVVLFVGRMVWKKGVHLLLDAVPEVLRDNPETVFVFVLGDMGKGFDAAYVAEMRVRYEESPHRRNLRFIENVSEKELPSYYQMADLCVFPSLQYESLPTVIYEAMACGVPIITQGSWGTPEVIDRVLLTEGDLLDDTLAENICILLGNAETRADIRRAYAERIPQFYWKNIATEYIDLYGKTDAD